MHASTLQTGLHSAGCTPHTGSICVGMHCSTVQTFISRSLPCLAVHPPPPRLPPSSCRACRTNCNALNGSLGLVYTGSARIALCFTGGAVRLRRHACM